MGNIGKKHRHNEDDVTLLNLPDTTAPRGQPRKVLLLGSHQAGKSTIFKQLRLIYGNGFTVEDLQSYVICIRKPIIESMQALFDAQGFPVDQFRNTSAIDEFNKNLPNMDAFPADIPQALTNAMADIWAEEPFVRFVHERAASLQIRDNMPFFFTEVTRIMSPNYLPTQEDVLRCHTRTTGIVESVMCVERAEYSVIDVGGARNERRKWIHAFEDVAIVIFFVSLADYDILCYEDAQTNRMVESLNLWSEIVNARWFRTSTICLLFTKADVLAEKICQSSIKSAFPDYDGPEANVEAAIDYIRQKFLNKNNDHELPILSFTISSLSQANVQDIFYNLGQARISRDLVVA